MLSSVMKEQNKVTMDLHNFYQPLKVSTLHVLRLLVQFSPLNNNEVILEMSLHIMRDDIAQQVGLDPYQQNGF